MEKRVERLHENSVMRKVFGPKRDEVTGNWKKLHRGVMICTAHEMSV
jgi:hypothetical protein